MHRTKAERAPIVAAIMARRYDMGLAENAKAAKRQRHPARYPWKRAAASGAAESRAKRAGSAGRSPALTEEQWAEARRLRSECGWSQSRIASHFGISKITVHRHIGGDGITAAPPPRKLGDPGLIARALEYHAQKQPAKLIKDNLGISINSYYRILRENGVDLSKRVSKGNQTG